MFKSIVKEINMSNGRLMDTCILNCGICRLSSMLQTNMVIHLILCSWTQNIVWKHYRHPSGFFAVEQNDNRFEAA